MTKGKFIVFYGINRLGKSTQTEIVKNELASTGLEVYTVKYPIYNLGPTGPRINDFLRHENPEDLSEFQHQELQLQNRRDYQPSLVQKLESGIWVLAEDYWLTGVAWGTSKGIDESWLKRESEKLLMEDFAMLFEGKPFEFKEENHRYETDKELMKRCRQVHLRLAQEYNIPVINANHSIEKVTQDILEILRRNEVI